MCYLSSNIIEFSSHPKLTLNCIPKIFRLLCIKYSKYLKKYLTIQIHIRNLLFICVRIFISNTLNKYFIQVYVVVKVQFSSFFFL